jgi:hypothetical protein
MTGSAARKQRLAGGDKGRNKQISSSPGSAARWAESLQYAEYACPGPDPGRFAAQLEQMSVL